ncbi:LysR family transcriptional regulator [Hydrogenophaga aquatica]
MNATFRQLRLFLALADLGSVSAAARATHVTQPTASMQLRELADAVGLPLHEVIGKKVYLTAAGEALASTARAMVGEWSLFEQQVAAMKGLHQGQLRVAVVSTAKYFVPRWLGAFCKAYPEVEIALEILNRDGVVQRLRRNQDDISIMSIPPKDLDIEQREFLPNPLVVVAPSGHPLAGRPAIPLAELAGERFILREPGSGTRMAAEAHFRAHAFTPQVRLALGSNEAIKQAVAGGMGLSVLSRHALAPDVAGEGLCVLDVEDFPIHASWYIVHLRGKQLSPLARVFQQHLLTQAHGITRHTGRE